MDVVFNPGLFSLYASDKILQKIEEASCLYEASFVICRNCAANNIVKMLTEDLLNNTHN